MAGCVCGGKKVGAKKVGAKKVPPKKVPAKSHGNAKQHQSAASKKASAIATKKALKNNPYAKGCNCS